MLTVMRLFLNIIHNIEEKNMNTAINHSLWAIGSGAEEASTGFIPNNQSADILKYPIMDNIVLSGIVVSPFICLLRVFCGMPISLANLVTEMPLSEISSLIRCNTIFSIIILFGLILNIHIWIEYYPYLVLISKYG